MNPPQEALSQIEERERFNPFPGLRPFDSDEDHLFFGRERETDQLLRRLRTNRFVSVLGTSGSGKSSLVRSGLIPSLYSGYMVKAGSTWRVAVFRPGEDPIGNMAMALNIMMQIMLAAYFPSALLPTQNRYNNLRFKFRSEFPAFGH